MAGCIADNLGATQGMDFLFQTDECNLCLKAPFTDMCKIVG